MHESCDEGNAQMGGVKRAIVKNKLGSVTALTTCPLCAMMQQNTDNWLP